MKCVGTLTKCPYTAGDRSRRGSHKAGTTVDKYYNVSLYTGMDKTSLDTSCGTIFVRDSLTQSTSRRTKLSTIVRRETIERRLTQLRNITSDCYLNIVVSLD